MVNACLSKSFSSSEHRSAYEYRIALDCIIPLLMRWDIDVKDAHVLDFGCGTGGVAVALAEKGATCVGFDHNDLHIREAKRMAADHGVDARFVCGDALDVARLNLELDGNKFDLIVLSEFLEHLVDICNVNDLLSQLNKHLSGNGHIYISFPPWFNPFGGHQAGWPVIQYVPWFHLIPDRLKYMIAPEHTKQYLEFSTELNHLTISTIERFIKNLPLVMVRREFFHLRPEFTVRYAVPTIRSRMLGRIPIIREVTTTGAYYLLAQS
jgi:2-polyprenyl-3-methyl-5-hydroxy-6-metoxy-1,4-benzoquinol methylase